MKKAINQLLTALLAAILALIYPAAAEEANALVLPDGLLAIEAEAFRGADGIDRVELADGVERIGSLAFAESSVGEIVVPASVSSIAEDAFSGCERECLIVERDSYAHDWCAFRDVNYRVNDTPLPSFKNCGVYGVSFVTKDDEEGGAQLYVRALVTTTSDCRLIVNIEDEFDEAEWIQKVVGLKSGLVLEEIDIPLTKTLPEYFTINASLAGETGTVLGDIYYSQRYTSAYTGFENQTPDTQPEARVVSFGSSGYGVLAENVIPIGTEAEVHSGLYIFPSEHRLQTSDIVLVYVDGTPTPLKIEAIGMLEDGRYVIYPSENVYLSEIYDTLNIDGALEGADAQSARNIDYDETIVEGTQSAEVGPIDLSLYSKIGGRVKFVYDKNIFGEDYFDLEISLDLQGSLSVTLGGSYDTWLAGYAPAIQIYNSVVIIPGIQAPAFLNVSVPFNLKTEAGGTAEITYHNRLGFRYNPNDGYQPIKTKESDAEARIKGDFEIEFGPEVSLTATILGFAGAKVGGQFGFRLEGTLDSPAYGGSLPEPESIHACTGCVDMDIDLFAELRASLDYHITQNLKGKLLDMVILSGAFKVGDAYFSFLNEPQSIYGGEESFAFSECQNLKHRYRFFTLDMEGGDVEGIPVTVTGEKTDDLLFSSPGTAYFYPGAYNASAAFDSGIVDKDFNVGDKSGSVTLQEECVFLSGTVKDNDTDAPIPGANVRLTLESGVVLTAQTDSEGEYSFAALPAGSYEMRFSADGYESRTLKTHEHTAGTSSSVSVSLVPEKVSLSGVITDAQTHMPIPGALAVLTLPDGTTVSDTASSTGAYGFSGLPSGIYGAAFSAGGYSALHMMTPVYTPGSDNTLNVSLEPAQELPLLLASCQSGRVQALTEEGTCPEHVPEVFINVSANNYGMISKVTVEHENCSAALSYTPEIMPFQMDFFAVNMGNGAYTYVLMLANSGTGGGSDILVFRESGGSLVVLKRFIYSGFTDNIYVKATFSSDTEYTGTLYPTGRTFSGVAKASSGSFNRTGGGLYDRTLGDMKYVLREDGCYDLIFSTSEYCLGNWDSIGSSKTRYVMENGTLTIAEQWYEAWSGTVSNH